MKNIYKIVIFFFQNFHQCFFCLNKEIRTFGKLKKNWKIQNIGEIKKKLKIQKIGEIQKNWEKQKKLKLKFCLEKTVFENSHQGKVPPFFTTNEHIFFKIYKKFFFSKLQILVENCIY